MRIIFRIVSEVFPIDISTWMSLAQLFLFCILDTLEKEYTLTYAVESITSDSDKITFVAKRQIEVSSTSANVICLAKYVKLVQI